MASDNHRSIEEASPEARIAAAIAALEHSRESLVTAVSPKKAKARASANASASSALPDFASSAAPRTPSTLGAIVTAIGAVMRGWWRHHPLRHTVEEVETTGNALIGPHVRRHPALALAGAAGVGAALVLVFPRRGWALALPWLGMEARGMVRTFWRSWHGRPPAATPH
jgi:hypothetical protein